jgi:3-carboxy-cis,cis-muconate cycloisomerase
VLPLVRQLSENVPSELAKYIHWGATTQDIMDDASVLQIQRGLRIIRRELDTLVEALNALTKEYRDT